MTHAIGQYLNRQLGDKLAARRVVVFYDPKKSFETFFSRELEIVGHGYDDVPRAVIGEELSFVVTYEGSFFGTRAVIEPIVKADAPERLLIYVPGILRSADSSVLMELEKGGTDYCPELKRVAREVLRRTMSDGHIDQILRSEGLTYDDLVQVLESGEEGTKSVLRTIFRGKPSEVLLAAWIAEDGHDEDITSKGAKTELLALLESRLGLSVESEVDIADVRQRAVRYALVNEFRLDLTGDEPSATTMIVSTSTKEQAARVREVTSKLREEHPEVYVELADGVARDMGLSNATVDASALGAVDTFRFEEQALLELAAELVTSKDYSRALALIEERAHSFWVDRDVLRQAQWQACRAAAELGVSIESAKAQLPSGADPRRWVDLYTASDGWFVADQLHRRMESWLTGMDEEPEAEKGIGIVRAQYELLVRQMTEGFVRAVIDSDWDLSGVRRQTSTYKDFVAETTGKVAYFLVDSLRFEMGAEIARQLERAKELRLTPALASLPSVTPVGMASLLPEASSRLSVVERGAKVAARVGDSVLGTAAERMRFLEARVPGALDITLGELLSAKPAALAKRLGGVALVAVRSQEIDFVGETDSDLLARQVMDSVIGNIVRAVNKLAAAGVEHFVISADHGHLFSGRKEDDMKIEAPGGETVELHRRCWIGRGGSTPAGAVRVSGEALGYESDLEFIFPLGAGVFKAGGGLAYHHGGVSLQEMVVPVVSFRMPAEATAAPSVKTVTLADLPTRITNRTFSASIEFEAQLFTEEPPVVRVVLVSEGEQVGQAGMAADGDLDVATGILAAKPGARVSVGFMLARDDVNALRVVVQDPKTDAVIAQSDEIPVELGV